MCMLKIDKLIYKLLIYIHTYIRNIYLLYPLLQIVPTPSLSRKKNKRSIIIASPMIFSRRIYWTNSNRTNPSIEYSNLDGSNRTIIFKGPHVLYEPLAVAIDHAERKLYWIDDVEGIHFKIERSNLDGSEREVLVYNTHQQPAYLAVDSESIYWSDWVHNAIWTMPKNIKAGDYPTKFRSFDLRYNADPIGIVTRDNVGKIDCATIASMIEKKRANLSRPVPQPLNETFNNLTTSTEESDLTTESSRYCLNDGHLNKTDKTCHCKPG